VCQQYAVIVSVTFETFCSKSMPTDNTVSGGNLGGGGGGGAAADEFSEILT
jgi:hypothetical protein